MKKPGTKKTLALLLALCLVWGSFFGLRSLSSSQPLPYYEEMVSAARRMEACMTEIRAEKARRGIAPEPKDLRASGLIGPENTALVTTLGALEAKRTAADPDMAALCVRIFHEAGLKEGDTLGLCMSGSFPGLVLASLTAADEMGLKLRYVCSVGASTYGATDVDFTLPEMLLHLADRGLLSTAPLAVTWGGEGDAGLNMIGRLMEETDALDAIEKRLVALGWQLPGEKEYTAAVEWREELYGDLDCFVNVGGHLAATGRDGQAYELGEGLIKPQRVKLSDRSGLVERYLARDIPTVSLINVKKLCLAYGMPFDPPIFSEPGSSPVYFRRSLFGSSR